MHKCGILKLRLAYPDVFRGGAAWADSFPGTASFATSLYCGLCMPPSAQILPAVAWGRDLGYTVHATNGRCTGTHMAEQEPVFMIERVYIKDLSFESPNSPRSFFMTEAPTVDVGLNTETHEVEGEENLMEVVLTVTVTAKSGTSTYFAVEVQQAGVFRLQNIPAEHAPLLLAVHCPTILFPYAREAVADLVGRGGFQPLHLHPVNFEALYQQAQQEQSEHTTQ